MSETSDSRTSGGFYHFFSMPPRVKCYKTVKSFYIVDMLKHVVNIVDKQWNSRQYGKTDRTSSKSNF
jgi:hypothetical protein